MSKQQPARAAGPPKPLLPPAAEDEIMDVLSANMRISSGEIAAILKKHGVSGDAEALQNSYRKRLGQRLMSSIRDENGSEMVERMGSFYPIVRLHRFYNIDTEITNLEDGILMWIESSDRSFCLFVDDLIGEQQVVVKPLPVFLNSFELKNYGVGGCTILGDGNISIILDVPSLYTATLENI